MILLRKTEPVVFLRMPFSRSFFGQRDAADISILVYLGQGILLQLAWISLAANRHNFRC